MYAGVRACVCVSPPRGGSVSRAAARKTVDSPPLSRLESTHAPIKAPHGRRKVLKVSVNGVHNVPRHRDPFIIKTLLYERARVPVSPFRDERHKGGHVTGKWGGVHFARRIIN